MDALATVTMEILANIWQEIKYHLNVLWVTNWADAEVLELSYFKKKKKNLF